MANIKMCPRCCGRPHVIHTKRGYIWRHKCKAFDDDLEFTSRPFDKFGDMVKDWNIRVKRVKEIQNMVLHHDHWEGLK